MTFPLKKNVFQGFAANCAGSRAIVCVLLVLALFPHFGGCVRRRMTVNTNPPGAMAYVDNRPIGLTPVSTPFTYYATREFRVEKAGFETASGKRTIGPPWYQIPPLDFFAENFWPGELRDERVVNFDLQPQRMVAPAEVRQRGENLRASVRDGRLTALPGANFQGPLPAPQPASNPVQPPGALPSFGRPVLPSGEAVLPPPAPAAAPPNGLPPQGAGPLFQPPPGAPPQLVPRYPAF